jgi:HlyD family secretion protein
MQIVKKYWIGLLALVMLLLAVVSIYRILHPKVLPANLIEGTGRIDGDLIALNTKYPGRVERITVEDGMAVEKGALIAVLRSREYAAKKEQIDARIAAEQKNLEAKSIELEMANTTIPTQVRKAREGLKSAQAKLKVLDENIAAKHKVLEQAQRDHNRSIFLYKTKAIDSHAFELSRLKVETEQDGYDALLLQRSEVLAAIAVAQSTLEEALASQAKLRAMEKQIEAMKEGIRALEEGAISASIIKAVTRAAEKAKDLEK